MLTLFLFFWAILLIGLTRRKGGKGKLTCRFATWMGMSFPGCVFSEDGAFCLKDIGESCLAFEV